MVRDETGMPTMNELPTATIEFHAELDVAGLDAAADDALASQLETMADLMWMAGAELPDIAAAVERIAAGVVGGGFRIAAEPDRAAWDHDRSRIVLLILEREDEFEDAE